MDIIIIFIIIVVFCMIYFKTTPNNQQKKKKVLLKKPKKETFTISPIEESTYNKSIERKQINDFNDSFFNFNNRINNSSIVNDPITKINILRSSTNENIGESIQDIYDNIANPNMI